MEGLKDFYLFYWSLVTVWSLNMFTSVEGSWFKECCGTDVIDLVKQPYQ